MNSSNIIIGPGYLTFNAVSFRFGEGGIKVKFIKKMREVSAEEFGRFDSTQTDRMIEVTGKLWSGYENLATLFPATMLTPIIGSPLFGVTDKPLVINGQDGSRLTIARAMITQFTNLSLSVEKELWSADVKWTCLLASGSTPTTANAYFTDGGTANSYTAPAFAKANFKAPVIAASWGARTGLTAMAVRKGLEIAGKYDLDFEPCYVDGFGTLDAIVQGFEGSAKGNPIGPTFAQILTNMGMGTALGALESTTNTDDLVITATGIAITLYAAFIEQNDGFAWSKKNNRVGDLTWRTTVPFTTGAPTARAAIS
jgi:hypothetical protein